MPVDPCSNASKRRGRPPRDNTRPYADTRQLLVQAGLVMLTQRGYSSVGIEEVLRQVGVPKGSFYHYFGSKEAFGQVLIAAYHEYFCRKLERCLLHPAHSPLQRVQDFVDDAKNGMAKYGFQRGCLVGNLGQEMNALPESFRQQLIDVFSEWQQRMAQCLREAQAQQQIPASRDCEWFASYFWIGWEGAVLRAKLEQSAVPLDIFARGFMHLVQSPHQPT
ncbi:transcriptional regulator, TetR family [Lampropedia hyalina DSM 16112]|jgi:TetR/AcrR family transcriptional repressor of nem operon|uniref:Transcriptional regulator, TetR family n=1 Tax=Lampropedia hyalina DSM 16112 TaxID=1122156 RepID=A0A1M5AAG2_9BURK|nr:TetR/AcrR family transcriptional regulator [Lampropedia hyalina]SHF27165.1 transcriptional regulator, TetR family [Lampropedia hyalina DSM 16112]